MNNEEKLLLETIRFNILKSNGWAFLRYIHLRDFISSQSNINSVGVCGTGMGFAELALALEFPNLDFYLTDIICEGRPNFHRVMELTFRYNLRNIRFGIWDTLKKSPQKFDSIVSTEILEHIKEAGLALQNMIDACNKSVYCLAPYAPEDVNLNIENRLAAYIQHEHFVCGFDENFFGNIESPPVY